MYVWTRFLASKAAPGPGGDDKTDTSEPLHIASRFAWTLPLGASGDSVRSPGSRRLMLGREARQGKSEPGPNTVMVLDSRYVEVARADSRSELEHKPGG